MPACVVCGVELTDEEQPYFPVAGPVCGAKFGMSAGGVKRVMGPYQRRRLDPARRTRRLREGFNPKQRRYPKGNPRGGQFAPAKGGGGAGLSGDLAASVTPEMQEGRAVASDNPPATAAEARARLLELEREIQLATETSTREYNRYRDAVEANKRGELGDVELSRIQGEVIDIVMAETALQKAKSALMRGAILPAYSLAEASGKADPGDMVNWHRSVEASAPRTARGHWHTAAGEFMKMVSVRALGEDPLMPMIAMNPSPNAKRAKYLPDITAVNLTKSSFPSAVAHELGHWLEHNSPGLQGRAQTFLRQRAGDEIPRSLSKLTGQNYNSREIAIKDKFSDPYTGKVYESGSTEIVSMGMEYMFTDPAEFARRDPGHFDFTWEAMNGSQ